MEVEVIFERESICAGDDVFAPNSKRYEIEAGKMLSEIVREFDWSCYIPNFHQGTVIWNVEVGGIVVATIKTPTCPSNRASARLLVNDFEFAASRVFLRRG